MIKSHKKSKILTHPKNKVNKTILDKTNFFGRNTHHKHKIKLKRSSIQMVLFCEFLKFMN